MPGTPRATNLCFLDCFIELLADIYQLALIDWNALTAAFQLTLNMYPHLLSELFLPTPTD